eukprot:TRINITY_DN59234_c0_g1_i1.p1 TRINITY_DN59234_c0_g1~~TRINITY_DN59234_c0_g1_i1.p1  ORF type:complete len:486 (+),score=30.05 TRINITY_DN59234_c0_g1_i1:92-1549(+)
MCKTEQEEMIVSWEEVAKHNTPSSAWIVIHGTVFDVTSFFTRHPGGKNVLKLSAGTDCSWLFETNHATTGSARSLLQHHIPKVGKVNLSTDTTNAMPVYNSENAVGPSSFLTTVQQRGYQHFRANKIDFKEPTSWFSYYILPFLGWLITNALIVCVPSLLLQQQQVPAGGGVLFGLPWWHLAIIISILRGIAVHLIAVHSWHDASHYCITHSPRVWRAMGFASDCILAASELCWTHQHTLGHHLHTNMDGVDPDISTNADTDKGDLIRRMTGTQKWRTQHRWQFLYLPVLYSLILVNTSWVEEWEAVWKRRWKTVKMNPLDRRDMFEFLFAKFFWLFYAIFLPTYIFALPFWTYTFPLLTITQGVGSMLISLSVVPSHFTDAVESYPCQRTGLIEDDWGMRQVRASADWCTRSPFWCYFAGYLNVQVVHHLFPGVHPMHFPKLLPIVEKTISEFGGEYKQFGSPISILSHHILLLYKLGLSPSQK